MNFQQKISQASPSERGHINEARFFGIMRAMLRSKDRPEWLVDIRRATYQEDLMGVDGFAMIEFLDGSLRDVPFQVKSSHEYLGKHIAYYKVFWVDKLRYFIASPKHSDEEIQKAVLDELAMIYRNNERFDRALEYLKTGEYVSPYERMVRKNP